MGSAAEAVAFKSGRSRPAGWAVRDLSDRVFGTIFTSLRQCLVKNSLKVPPRGPHSAAGPPPPERFLRPGDDPSAPKTVQESPKTAQESIQTAPDRPKTLKMASRRPKTPLRRP